MANMNGEFLRTDFISEGYSHASRCQGRAYFSFEDID
jgi:hypothetical protein